MATDFFAYLHKAIFQTIAFITVKSIDQWLINMNNREINDHLCHHILLQKLKNATLRKMHLIALV